MSRKGDCWDNAPMESVNGTVKVECVHGENFKTRAEAARAIVEYLGYYLTPNGCIPRWATKRPANSSGAGAPRTSNVVG